MERFVWTEDISVDVEEIDEQHKHFIEIVNSLVDLSNQNEVSREELMTHAMQLGDYALVHFGTEEEHFETFQYENTAAHKAAHDQYRSQFHDIINQIRDESNDAKKLAWYTADFAGNWLIHHIKVMDKQFTASFHKHGLL